MNYDDIESELAITIKGVKLAYAPMLADVLRRVGQRFTEGPITIYCAEPDRDQSIQYILQTPGITICCLRRTQDAETEYHS